MAKDPNASSQENPQLAHFRHREKEIAAKIDRLKNQQDVPGHDKAEAIARNEGQLKQIRQEIKTLEGGK